MSATRPKLILIKSFIYLFIKNNNNTTEGLAY